MRDLRKRIRAVDHAVRDVVADHREHDHAAPESSERANGSEIRHLAREFRHDLRVLGRTARHVEQVLSALQGSLQRFVNGAGAAAASGTETQPEPGAPTPVHDEPLPVHDEPLPAPPAAPGEQQKDIDPQIVKIANSVFELLKFVKRTLLPNENPTPTASTLPAIAKRAATAFQVPPVVNAPAAPAPVAVQTQQTQPTATEQPEQAEVDPRLQNIANSVFELLKFVKQTLLPNDPTEPAAASASFTRIAGGIDLLA